MSDFDRVQQMIARFNSAKSRADRWNSLLQRCYQYAIPDRNLYNTQSEGATKNSQVYDTTAVDATISLTSKLQATLTPPFAKWARLEAGTDVPEEFKDDFDKQLEAATDLIFKYIHRSNFDMVANESYFDLAIGTAAMSCSESEDDDNPLVFSSVPLEQLAPEEGPNGTIETVWRYHRQILVDNILRLWPQGKLPSVLNDLQHDKNTSSHTTNIIEGSVYNPKTKLYEYVVIHPGSQEFIYQREDEVSPWIVYRWSRVGTEVYGRGPVIFALPSILSLNKMMEFELKSAAMAVSPPYMAYSDGLMNPYSVTLQPGAVIPVNRGQAGVWPIQPLPTNPNYQFGQLLAAEMRQQINNLFFTQPLGEIEGSPRTAYEMQLRQQALAEKIGPAFGRLQVEYLPKVIDRVVYILKKRGLFPDLKVDGNVISVKYVSPLALAQTQSDVAAFQQFYGILQSVVGPEMAIHGINETKLPMWLAGKTGAALELVKTEQQLEALKDILRQQQEAQQQAELEAQQQQQGVQQ